MEEQQVLCAVVLRELPPGQNTSPSAGCQEADVGNHGQVLMNMHSVAFLLCIYTIGTQVAALYREVSLIQK